PAARIQLVTVRRPRARIAPRKSRTNRTADRGSRAAARAGNQWHAGAGVWDDGMAGPSVVRGQCGNRHRPGRAGTRLPAPGQPPNYRKLRKLLWQAVVTDTR